ncbi:olfactory receptor 1500-like [Paramisgurnus dabryanus]|uniref:olfactory receptor 1500-like n=1 Tax=Paramisgurnus dabryanus TaxID=90735 RepID=UPI003CCFDB5B
MPWILHDVITCVYVFAVRAFLCLVFQGIFGAMAENSSTRITEIFLLGIPGVHSQYNGALGSFLLFVYLVLASGNILIISFIAYEKSLHKPSYFIFCNLAVSDLAFGTVTLPKVVAKYLAKNDHVEFYSCFVQMYIVHHLGTVNSFLMLLMAIDRFIAICNPLRYPAIITNQSISFACVGFWVVILGWLPLFTYQTAKLSFCASDVINQCFCDFNSLFSIGCGEKSELRRNAFAMAMFTLLGPLMFIIFSYIAIIISVFKISSIQARYKTFSTCSPQLLTICLYYIPRCTVYICDLTAEMPMAVRVMLVMWYSLLPPVVNPMIYCFRTQEIKAVLMKRIRGKIVQINLKTFAS